jgi:hypothetical protein
MGYRTVATRTTRLLAALALLLLVAATPSLAVDGAPVFQSAVFGTQFDDYAQIQPDAYEKFMAFVATPLPDGGTTHDSRVWVMNFQHGEAWAVRPGAFPSPVPGEQAHPAVTARDGVVYVVYEQADSSTMGSWDVDLWIWKGDEHGVAAAGYPKLLVSGPASTNQTRPSLASTTVGGSEHLVVAWQDDRLNGPPAPLTCVLDLTATDIDAVSYSPASAGFFVDQIVQAQYAPQVGPLGIVYLDDRWADASGSKSALRFCQLDGPTSAGSLTLFEAPNALDDNACPVPTVDGAAWLGPAKAGGPFQPYMKTLDGAARVIGVLSDPREIDSLWQVDAGPTPFTQLALTGRHGAIDRDQDVFFYDSIVKQMVPVCTVGSALPEDHDRLSQTQLAISWGPPPASGVVWADARHNPPGTAYQDLTYKLYLASLPLVRLSASRTTFLLGKTVTFTASVAPGLPGKSVKFQRGTKYTDTLYRITRYRDWTSLKTRTLSSTSKASWTWKPAKRGTYYIRANFAGAKVTDQTGALISWVPTPSKVVKIVVK